MMLRQNLFKCPHCSGEIEDIECYDSEHYYDEKRDVDVKTFYLQAHCYACDKDFHWKEDWICEKAYDFKEW